MLRPNFSEFCRVAFEEILTNFRGVHNWNFLFVWRALLWPNFSEVCRVTFEEILINFKGFHYGKFLCRLEGFVKAKL